MHEDTLSRVDLFSNLDKKELQALGSSCYERKYSPGSILMKQGDTGAGLFVITGGHVKITHSSSPDRAEEELATVGPGNVIGEMALLDDLPRSATVTAIDDVTALLLPVWEFRTILRNSPDIALKLLAVLSRRIRKLEGASRSNY